MRARILGLVVAAVGLYFVWPAVVQVFQSFGELTKIQPLWFVGMALLELASYACLWLLIGISTSSRRWGLIAAAQLQGNAVSSTVPGGAAAGGPLQYLVMVRGGEEPGPTASGLATASVLSTTTLFGLAALCVPLTARFGNVDARLERAAWLGLGAFVFMLLVGVAAFTLDGAVRSAARVVQWARNLVFRKRVPTTDLPERVLEQRDRVRDTLGSKWPWAVVAVVSKWAFDYFALLAAVAATGARVDSVPLLVAYLAASILALVPITPGGLGFVEAGLATTLAWAGLSAADATLATLAYRLVSYWLPLLVGVVAVVAYRRRRGAEPAATATS